MNIEKQNFGLSENNGVDLERENDRERIISFTDNKNYTKLDNVLSQTFKRLKMLGNAEKQDKLAVKLLLSDDFMKGETMVHQTQINYIKDMMNASDDQALKQKLKNKLELIEKSFLILQIFYQKAIHDRDEINGVGKNKPSLFLTKIASFAYPASFGLVGGAFAGIGEASLALAGAFGATGVISSYIIGEIRKYQLTKKHISISKDTLDFSSDQETELLEYLKYWEKFYQDQSKTLSDVLDDLKILNDYYQNKGNRLDQLSGKRISDEENRERQINYQREQEERDKNH